MRDLIKGYLFEVAPASFTIDNILKYRGNNPFLNDLKFRIEFRGKQLTPNQIRKAAEELKKEYWKNTGVEDIVRPYSQLKKLVTELGKKTYAKIVENPEFYEKFLQTLTQSDKRVFLGKPNEQWINRNISDLEYFTANTINNQKKFDFPTGGSMTLHQQAGWLRGKLEKQEFVGFIEDEGTWSILNKLDTNYSNWAKMIGTAVKERRLKGQTTLEKIENYFRQIDPITAFKDYANVDILKDNSPEMVSLIKRAKTMSFAEIDLIHYFNDLDRKNHPFRLNKIIKRISKTTAAGDYQETQFLDHLTNNGISNIHSFSSHGNVVDITFAIDLIADINGQKVPIQVKSNEESAKKSNILKWGIGGISIYPAPKNMQCGNWIYYKSDNRGLKKQGSFDEDFLNLHCADKSNNTDGTKN